MQPVVTVEEMRQIDAAATRHTPVETLIARAGAAVSAEALAFLGGGYGRRVAVLAGPGHNGDDGRDAADRLRCRGARVAVIAAGAAPDRLPGDLDLVIDAAYGTGLGRPYRAPRIDAPVLAVDIPSGLHGDTGEGEAAPAALTVTLAGLKPGLLLGAGPDLAGQVVVADIGLDCSTARAHLVEDLDVAEAGLVRPRRTHKWRSAVGVVAGSPGMMGAPELCARGALRAGAGTVRLGIPGSGALPGGEVVSRRLPEQDWSGPALEWTERCQALITGPGLGRSDTARRGVLELLAKAAVPVVVDADGLHALGRSAPKVLSDRAHPTVLTPHDGEFEALTGAPPGGHRIAAVADLARRTGAVVLLKGPTTIVAAPDGRIRFVTRGSSRLATAGAGDVLAGMIGAFLAAGAEALAAASLAAHVHGAAARRGWAFGLVAGDLPDLVAAVMSELAGPPPESSLRYR